VRVALGDLRPAEGREREIHGAGLVPVLAVAEAHLALIGLLLRCLETGKEVAFAFLLDGGAKLDIAARAEFASLENFMARSQPGAALIASTMSSIPVDFAGQSSPGRKLCPKTKPRKNQGQDHDRTGHTGFQAHGQAHGTFSLNRLGAAAKRKGSRAGSAV